MKSEKVPIGACRWRGHDDRFFGKFRDTDGRWKKIPGGPFAADINTKEKALACARRWYVTEMAERQVQTPKATSPLTWAQVCDEYGSEVETRLRGADSSRQEGTNKAKFLARSPILGARPIADHDEALALVWLRQIASEHIEPRDTPCKPRHPYTVRNIARHLRDIYRRARSRGYFARDKVNPCEGDEFRAELRFILSTVKRREVMCPIESVKRVVENAGVPEFRRLLTHVYTFTGLRPGELHGLQLADVMHEGQVTFLSVTKQWTLGRGKKYPERVGPLKTKWAERVLPIHPSLLPKLEDWIGSGWRKHVGRDPKPEDFLFPDGGGAPFREHNCDDFRADLVSSGCSTVYKSVELDVYSLRHTFATLMKKSGIPSDVRDVLLGHSPKTTKARNYEVDELPSLLVEITKIPPLMDAAPETKTPMERAPSSSSPTVAKTSALVPMLVTGTMHGSGASSLSTAISAEEVRFELTEGLHPRRFSKPVP